MFDLGREFKRIFRPKPAFMPPRDGLTGGDSALLELLDLDMLKAEARAADIAAGRVGVKDRGQRHLQQAIVWRELARRSGDAAALRKAAAAAESAGTAFKKAGKTRGASLARLEQGRCAALGAELFGDEGLNAAAAVAFAEADIAGKHLAPMAAQARARIEVMMAIAQADSERAFLGIVNCERMLPAPGVERRDRASRLDAIQARADLGEALTAAAERFSDERLVERATTNLGALAAGLDPAYEPLSWVRVSMLKARALVVLGELTGEVGHIVDGVSLLSEVLDLLPRDHSPLDWASVQLEMAHALQALGQIADGDGLDRAVAAYDRALMVLKRQPTLRQRAAAAVNRAMCVAQRAELCADRHALDEAEANFRCELASADSKLDPIWWAVCQMGLARIYEIRIARAGGDLRGRTRALLALNEALEVFSDHGLRDLADLCVSAIDRLQVRRPVGR